MCTLTGEVLLRSRHDQTEWLVATLHTIDGQKMQHRHVPGNSPEARVNFKQSCIRNMCVDVTLSAATRGRQIGIRPHVVLGGDTNLSKDDLMAVVTDLQQGFPGSIYVMGTKRDFLISTLRLLPIEVAWPPAHDTMHAAVGATAVADARPEALAVSQGQAASSSSSAVPVRPARTREWAEARAKELAGRLMERLRREKEARLAALAQAEAAAAQAAEETEEEPEVGLQLSRSNMFMA